MYFQGSHGASISTMEMANTDREPLLENSGKKEDSSNKREEGNGDPSGGASIKSGPSRESNRMRRLLSALFYACSSFFIMILIKNVLTANKFPSFQVRRQSELFRFPF